MCKDKQKNQNNVSDFRHLFINTVQKNKKGITEQRKNSDVLGKTWKKNGNIRDFQCFPSVSVYFCCKKDGLGSEPLVAAEPPQGCHGGEYREDDGDDETPAPCLHAVDTGSFNSTDIIQPEMVPFNRSSLSLYRQ